MGNTMCSELDCGKSDQTHNRYAWRRNCLARHISGRPTPVQIGLYGLHYRRESPDKSRSPEKPILEQGSVDQGEAKESEPSALYSFQLGSAAQLKDVAALIEKAQALPDARVEEIGRYYVVRFGLWRTPDAAQEFRDAAKRIAPDAFVCTVVFDQNRVVDPQLQEAEVKDAAPEEQRTRTLPAEDPVTDQGRRFEQQAQPSEEKEGSAAQTSSDTAPRDDYIYEFDAKEDREYVLI